MFTRVGLRAQCEIMNLNRTSISHLDRKPEEQTDLTTKDQGKKLQALGNSNNNLKILI